jgi:hypothetical protein
MDCRGGRRTTIRVVATVVGRPIDLLLGSGQQADSQATDALNGRPGSARSRLIADRAQDANRSNRTRAMPLNGWRSLSGATTPKQSATTRSDTAPGRVEATIGRLENCRVVSLDVV